MSKIISDASVKRSATATITRPLVADANASPSSVATWTWADRLAAGGVGGGEQRRARPRPSRPGRRWRPARRRPRRGSRSPAGPATSPRGRRRRPRRRPARGAASALRGHSVKIASVSLAAGLLAHRRRRLRDRRDPPRAQRLHRLHDRRRRRRASRPRSTSRSAAGRRLRSRPERPLAGPIGRRRSAGSRSELSGSMWISTSASGISASIASRSWCASSWARSSVVPGAELDVQVDVAAARRRGGRAACGSRPSRAARARGDRRLDPVQLLRRRRLVDQHAGGAGAGCRSPAKTIAAATTQRGDRVEARPRR